MYHGIVRGLAMNSGEAGTIRGYETHQQQLQQNQQQIFIGNEGEFIFHTVVLVIIR